MESNIDNRQVPFLNCNRPGAPLGTLLHCCSDAGIGIMDITPGEIVVERKVIHWTMDSNPNNNSILLGSLFFLHYLGRGV